MKFIDVCNKVIKTESNQCDLHWQILDKLANWLGIKGELVESNKHLAAYYIYKIKNACHGRDDYYRTALFLEDILVGSFTYNGDSHFYYFDFVDETSKKSVVLYLSSLYSIEDDGDDYSSFDDEFGNGVVVYNTSQLPSVVLYQGVECSVVDTVDDDNLKIEYNNGIKLVEVKEVLIPFNIE